MIELVYGILSEDMKSISKVIGIKLCLEFKEHHSGYKGVYYLAECNGSEFQVMENLQADFDDQPEEEKEYYWHFEDHKDCKSLLWFDLNESDYSSVKQIIENSKVGARFISETKY